MIRSAALRVMGRSDQRDYAGYHEVLNRAVWSPCEAARIVLLLLLQYLDRGDGPLIFGIDETLERCRGAQIGASGIYRDAVRSSRNQLVKASPPEADATSLMWLGYNQGLQSYGPSLYNRQQAPTTPPNHHRRLPHC